MSNSRLVSGLVSLVDHDFCGRFGRGVTRFGDKWLLWPLWSAHQPTTCGRQGSCHLPSGMWQVRHPAAACWWSPVHCRAKRTSPCSVGGLACPAVREGPACAPRLSSMSVPSSALPASVRCHLAGIWHSHGAGQSRHPTSPGCSTRVIVGTSLPLVLLRLCAHMRC